ncbi:hypothetical protein [Caldithrix abyssi]
MFSKRLVYVLTMLFGMASVSFAQTGEGQTGIYTLELIRIYFLLLLFATILNRLLEYLKILAAFLNDKFGLLTGLFNKIIRAVSQKLDGLGIAYDENRLSANVRKYTISALMQFLGFGMGVLLAFALQLNVLAPLHILPQNTTWGLIISGLLIGAGVEPVHSFFRIAQEKRKLKKMFTDLQK